MVRPFQLSFSDFELRLVSDNPGFEGRLEVFHGGAWGTVCDDYFGDIDAAVVCASLGLPGSSEAVGVDTFGPGSGAIFMDDVSCSGSEQSLNYCTHLGWGVHNCVHREDVGVKCSLDDTSGE